MQLTSGGDVWWVNRDMMDGGYGECVDVVLIKEAVVGGRIWVSIGIRGRDLDIVLRVPTAVLLTT